MLEAGLDVVWWLVDDSRWYYCTVRDPIFAAEGEGCGRVMSNLLCAIVVGAL
jgi:hypothetical protein